MAIATKPKPQSLSHKKRQAAHHRLTKHYVKSYWPYLPMVAIVAAGMFISGILNRPTAVLGVNSDLTQQALLDSSNTVRTENNQNSLTLDSKLAAAAQSKANDMVTKNYWSHNSPDGQTPWKFVSAAGYQYQAAGENLAYGFDAASTVTAAWMHSTEHRANLLDTNFSQVGFGVAQSANFQGDGPQTIVVALYGAPITADAGAPLEITPVSTTAVPRINTLAESAASGFIIGMLGTIAVVIVLLRHTIAWRKLLSRGELFVIHHPVLDIVLVGVATIAVLFDQTAGFIR